MNNFRLVRNIGSLPFCVAKNEGEGPETAAATVEGLAFKMQRRALRFSTKILTQHEKRFYLIDIKPPAP
jgi:hypothetical protein